MKPTDETETASDSLFETVSDTELSRADRIAKWTHGIMRSFEIIWEDVRTRVGFIIISMYILAGTIGVVVLPIPQFYEGPQLLPPFVDPQFILGTGADGRDLLGVMVHATPAILKMIIAGAVFATGVASIVGFLAGYKGGFIDRVLMIVTDIMMTMPGITFTVVLAAVFQPRNPFVVGIVLSINNWSGFARSLRSQVLTVREESFVEASRAVGLPTHSIIAFDLFPELAPLVAIRLMGTARGIIFESVGLYFLGVLPFAALNWGVVLNQAYKGGGALFRADQLHYFLVPMATITLFTFGLIMFAQGMDRLFNPRIRARHAEQGDVGEEQGAVIEDIG